jgi:hypothetical protein
MPATTAVPPGPIHRVLRALPVIGRVVRDIERDVDTVFYLIVIALTALVLAIMVWGLPALVLTAVAMVPVMFVFLILISRP